jgi:hypothetical protein
MPTFVPVESRRRGRADGAESSMGADATVAPGRVER